MFNLEKVSIDPTFFELNEKSKIEAAINRSLILNIVSYEEEESKSEDFERKDILYLIVEISRYHKNLNDAISCVIAETKEKDKIEFYTNMKSWIHTRSATRFRDS